MSEYEKQNLSLLLGADQEHSFPPFAVIDQPPGRLQSWQAARVIGIDPTAEGYIKKGACPAGETCSAETVTISGTVYTRTHERLWLADGSTLRIGAPWYSDVFMHHLPSINLEQIGNIRKMLPLDPTSVLVIGESSSVIISRCSVRVSPADFAVSRRLEGVKASYDDCAVTLANVGYVYVGDRLLAVSADGRVVDVSQDVQSVLSSLAGASPAVSCWPGESLVIVGDAFVYNARTGRWIEYSGGTFRVDTRALTLPTGGAFSVSRLMFHVEQLGSDEFTLSYNVKLDDAPWSKTKKLKTKIRAGRQVVFEGMSDEDSATCRSFQLRITGLGASTAIYAVIADGPLFNLDDGGYER